MISINVILLSLVLYASGVCCMITKQDVVSHRGIVVGSRIGFALVLLGVLVLLAAVLVG